MLNHMPWLQFTIPFRDIDLRFPTAMTSLLQAPRMLLNNHSLCLQSSPPPSSQLNSAPKSNYKLQTTQIPNQKQNKMSFLTRTAIRPVSLTARFAPRAFSTSFVARKTPTEAVKDTVKGVDRAVSDKLVDGIEIGREFYLPFLTMPFLLSPLALPSPKHTFLPLPLLPHTPAGFLSSTTGQTLFGLFPHI
jgi:hypothetical protein